MIYLPYILALSVAVICAALALRTINRPHVSNSTTSRSITKQLDTTPDRPINFGYKCMWVAIRSNEAESVIQSLPINDLYRANWQTGISAAYDGEVFISPPVNGWVFVVSSSLPELGHDRDSSEWLRLLQEISQKHHDVQYFGTHRVVGYCAWAQFKEGKEERAFAYLGESGQILVDRGSRTPGEIELRFHTIDSNVPLTDADDESGPELSPPDEEHVMELAGKWSVNPQTLETMNLSEGVGWVGTIRSSKSTR